MKSSRGLVYQSYWKNGHYGHDCPVTGARVFELTLADVERDRPSGQALFREFVQSLDLNPANNLSKELISRDAELGYEYDDTGVIKPMEPDTFNKSSRKTRNKRGNRRKK